MTSHVETFMDRCQFKWLKTIFLPFVICVCSRLIGCCSNGCGYPFRKIFNHANGCCCLFEKNVHPFERLVLPAQTPFETVWNGLNIYFTSIHLIFVLTIWWISASVHHQDFLYSWVRNLYCTHVHVLLQCRLFDHDPEIIIFLRDCKQSHSFVVVKLSDTIRKLHEV